MEWTDKIRVTNEDNMQLMSRYPDNYFELAIVDPPYGIGAGKMQLGIGKKRQFISFLLSFKICLQFGFYKKVKMV